MKVINLTPHPVTILDDNNEIMRTIPVSGIVARLVIKTKDVATIDGIRITKTEFLSVQGLPDPEEGKFFIVSQMVKNSPLCVSRDDLLVPTDIVREEGKPLGCKALGC